MPARLPIDIEQLRVLIEEEKRTQHQVAQILACSLSVIERRCRRHGLKTQRTGPRSGSGHTNWKGGRKKVGRYWYLYDPQHPMATKNGYVAEHRKIMAQLLARPLLRTEVVHHKDANPDNNALSNLVLFQSNRAHLAHELAGRRPKWTPEGLARIRAGARAAASRRALKQRAAAKP